MATNMNSVGIGATYKNRKSVAKSNDSALAVMQQMLQERCIAEPSFAIKMANPSKSMEGAVNYLCSQIQKSGLCMVDDSTVLALLTHYFDENEIEDPGKVKCNIVVSKPELSEEDKALLKEQAMEQYKEEQLRQIRRENIPKASPKPTTAPKAGAEINVQPSLFDFYKHTTMKPRNRKQQEIMALSGQLRPLTHSQKQWALSNTISHYGFRLKSGMCTCMKCGHEWLEERNGTHLCPECGAIIEIKDTKERVIHDKSYFNIITTKGGYQVVRMFLMMVEMRKGMKANPAFLEIGQYWIDDKGKATVVGIQRKLGHYIDSFAFGYPLEIRNDNDAFKHIAGEWVYPKITVTNTIKRNGFRTSTYYSHPVTLFQELLTNPKAETLMKANDMELLRYLCARPLNKMNIDNYWNTIKIAKRAGYKFTDIGMWFDYIKLFNL